MGIYSGATVMGDGSVVLILDLRGITMAADIPLSLVVRVTCKAHPKNLKRLFRNLPATLCVKLTMDTVSLFL